MNITIADIVELEYLIHKKNMDEWNDVRKQIEKESHNKPTGNTITIKKPPRYEVLKA